MIQITEKKSLSPNVMTFGVLALGCQEYNDAKEFLAGIETFGYKPNVVIMGTLLRTACFKKNLGYVLFVMEYMMKNRIKPNTKIIQILVEFSKNMQKLREPKVCRTHICNSYYKYILITPYFLMNTLLISCKKNRK